MPRISDEELAQLKRSADLLALVRESGIELRRHGKDWVGRCEWHPDNEPSLIVSPQKNPPLWRCAGACNVGGTAVDWLMRVRSLSFIEAMDELRRRQGVNGNGNGHAPAVTPMPPPGPLSAAAAELLGRVWGAYRQVYRESEEAQRYAASRGLADAEALERFGLGYCDGSLARRLGLARSRQGDEPREALVDLGVLHEDGSEHFAGYLLFSIPGPAGLPINLYGRRITDDGSGSRHLYLPGPRRGLWNPEGLDGASELILAESVIDAWTLWCAGFRNVTCAWGTNGVTADHLAAIEGAGVTRLLIAYDADKAGDQAASKLAAELPARGIACSRVRLPRGTDVNEYARKVTPAKESLALALRAAEPIGEAPRAAAIAAPAAAVASGPPTTSPAAPPPFDPKEPLDVAMGDRRWRVRGIERNLSYEKLQVLLRVGTPSAFFVDTVDLAQSKQRSAFLRAAAAELEVDEEVLRKDLRRLHLRLEELQDRLIREQLEPKDAPQQPMAPAAEAAALEYLRQPDLLERILADFDRCGVVGERINKLLGYVAATSRKLEQPLAVIIQSSSAAGKSSLMEAILAFMPEEERVQYSAMTGQSLFYMGESNLAHKILAIVEEEGAERASYALKLLQSEGELTIASTGKDPETGRLVTHEYRVEGPVAIFLTTTAIDVDEELLNRCLVLSVDESREQTRAIHRLQRERRTLEGMLARRERERVVELHRNVQRLLQPLPIINPFAPRLTFLDCQTRSRRDHEKYLTLIDAIALLHQHQRPRKTTSDRAGKPVEYLEVEAQDVALANRLAGEVLGRSLDELPPQTRRFLDDLERLVGEDCRQLEIDRCDYRFIRRQVAERIGWSYFQTRKHLDRLVDLEYVVPHRGGRGQSFLYELVYDGQGRDGRPFLLKLLDVDGATAAESLSPSEAGLSPSGSEIEPPLSPQRAPVAPPLRTRRKSRNSLDSSGLQSPTQATSENSRSRRADPGDADVGDPELAPAVAGGARREGSGK